MASYINLPTSKDVYEMLYTSTTTPEFKVDYIGIGPYGELRIITEKEMAIDEIKCQPFFK